MERTIAIWVLALLALVITCCGGEDKNLNCPGAYFPESPAQNPNPDPKNDAIPCFDPAPTHTNGGQ